MLKKMILSELRLNRNGIAVIVIAMFFPLLALLNYSGIYFIIGFYLPLCYIACSAQYRNFGFYAALPVKRDKQVTATVCVTLILECAQLAMFALIAVIVRLTGSTEMWAPNLLSICAVCVGFGLFNLVVLPVYFAVDIPAWTFGMLCFTYISGYFGVYIPLNFLYADDTAVLAGYDPHWLWLRIVVCIAGFILLIAMTAIAYGISRKEFAKKNL